MPSEGPIKKIFLSRWFLAASLIAAVLVAFAYARAYYQDFQVRKEIERLQEDVRSLETKKLSALQVLDYVKSFAFVEEKARTELNLAKPGERVSVFLTTSSFASRIRQDSGDMLEWRRLSNYKKWARYFMGRGIKDE
ncbi:MAG: hypothetical protein UX39_C0010G0010 [Candidatus Magasanikbacteria bacterium GW2011_GWA2_46_17]|uniref:Septum formation initiator n=1 Tax=Candidatus Magasanikbacteria bacterium GW2011_GWA2_46_17 TaxID=1619042 RepID=A0A0G1R8C0_9BACT|nr:MAG: hypothetical protein UX39_C0010G0010 [Candidatus Magasanikbacteria bacterium GW2011_GWA2_46_17]